MIRACQLGLGGIVCMCMLTIAPVGAEIYKWVDKDGNVHYGDKPPDTDRESHQAKELHIPGQKNNTTDNENTANRQEYQQKLLEAMQTKRQQKKQEAGKIAQEREQAKQNCVKAKDLLRSYEEAGFLYDLNDKGERVVLTDERRKQATENAKLEVGKWCR